MESVTITVVLDNVGTPQFRNVKGTWPDVMFHGFFGFQEPVLGWEPTFDDLGNPITSTSEACHAPLHRHRLGMGTSLQVRRHRQAGRKDAEERRGREP